MRNMRIVFSVCGIGMGHSHRSYRLMKALAGEGHEIFVITSGDGAVFFRDKEFKAFYVEELDFEWSESGVSLNRTIAKSLEHSYTLYKHYTGERRVISVLNPDLIVVDSRGAPLIVAKQYNIPSILITNQLAVISRYPAIDKVIARYMPKFWALADKIIVSDISPPYTITYLNNVYPLSIDPELENKVYFTGPLLDFKWLSSHLKKINNEKVYDVFIFISAPSLDRKFYAMHMIDLAKTLSKNHKVLLSIGEPKFREYKIGLNGLDIWGWVKDPFEMLSKSKIVVLRGGQTAIMESIITMTPMLVLPAYNQTEQIENARRVKALGIGEYIDPDIFYSNKEVFFEKIEQLLSKYEYYVDNLKLIREKLFSSGGVDKAIDIILGLA